MERIKTDIHIYLIACFSLLYLLKTSNAMTLDEIIASAANSSMEFDFFYDEQNAVVKVEYDMEYTMEDWKILQELNKNVSEKRKKRKAVRRLNSRWTDNTIPYEVAENTFTSTQRAEITAAVDEWRAFTCLKFRRPRSSDRNKIRFQNGGGCSSFVGMIRRNPQAISLAPGCRVKGVIVHEIGHAVGFHHEQTRPDRDSFVRIVRQNIPSNLFYNFQKYTTAVVNSHDVPYDYQSVMHYGKTAFSTNGQPTIITTDPKFENVIGNRKGLSFRDIKLANAMYSCASSSGCAKKNCPGEGFVGKDCKCWCPGNPVQHCGGGDKIETGSGNGETGSGNGETGSGNGGSGGTKTGECKNMNSNCVFWANKGECEKNPAYMKEMCKPACDVCKTEIAVDCEDMNKHCDYWQSKGYCKREFVEYMTENCPKACDVCESDENSGLDEDSQTDTTLTSTTVALPSTSSSLSQCFISITCAVMFLVCA